jgi:hypothetical protein
VQEEQGEEQGEGRHSGRGAGRGLPTRRHRANLSGTRSASTASPHVAVRQAGIMLSMNSATAFGRISGTAELPEREWAKGRARKGGQQWDNNVAHSTSSAVDGQHVLPPAVASLPPQFQ